MTFLGFRRNRWLPEHGISCASSDKADPQSSPPVVKLNFTPRHLEEHARMSYLAQELKDIVARFSPRGAPRPEHSHDHDLAGDHGHTHEHLDNAGKYGDRDLPVYEGRNWDERAFTVGIGG